MNLAASTHTQPLNISTAMAFSLRMSNTYGTAELTYHHTCNYSNGIYWSCSVDANCTIGSPCDSGGGDDVGWYGCEDLSSPFVRIGERGYGVDLYNPDPMQRFFHMQYDPARCLHPVYGGNEPTYEACQTDVVAPIASDPESPRYTVNMTICSYLQPDPITNCSVTRATYDYYYGDAGSSKRDHYTAIDLVYEHHCYTHLGDRAECLLSYNGTRCVCSGNNGVEGAVFLWDCGWSGAPCIGEGCYAFPLDENPRKRFITLTNDSE